MSSKVSSSFSAETMLPLRLRFLLGVPKLEALIEPVAGLLSEPVSGLLAGPVGGLFAELTHTAVVLNPENILLYLIVQLAISHSSKVHYWFTFGLPLCAGWFWPLI